MRVMNFSILAASLIGGAAMLSGFNPASAATLAPAFVQSQDRAAVQEVRHDWAHRSGRLQGKRYWQPKNTPHDRYGRYGFRRSGPAVSFGLSGPGFSFGFGAPAARYGYAPHGYSYGLAPPYNYGYGWRYR